MKIYLLNSKFVILVISVVIVGVAMIPALVQDPADAKSTRKIHFTETFVSFQDPGQGHGNHQMALVLSPEPGVIYDGSMTYTADVPVQVAVLHEIGPDESHGQPTWTVDGKTIYGITLIDAAGAASFEFTGAALALHGPNPQSFAATVSVDGWIRDGTIQYTSESMQIQHEPSLDLYMSNVPVQIPMHTGFHNGSELSYIITDSSDADLAKTISEKQNWNVEAAPVLSATPDSILQTIYLFTNGVKSDGIYGFQNAVFSNTPEQRQEYTALRKIVEVSWYPGQRSAVLTSVEDIIEAKQDGKLNTKETDAIINAPQIIWPDGQMPVRQQSTLDDDTPYIGGQILEIDTESGVVTFVAHRGWGPDGKTIYYIVTDATPTRPAQAMGVLDAPTSAELVSSSAAINLYQFTNGLKGSGPLGFQPGIADSATGDQRYSPMWRIFLVEWNNPDDARVLQTIHDISQATSNDEITVSIAKPTGRFHVVNCPFIDPFQN